MNDQMRIWIRTCSTYCFIPAIGSAGSSASAMTRTMASGEGARTSAAQPRRARMPPGRAKIITMNTTKAMT